MRGGLPSFGMMVLWDAHGQVSGALHRRMVPLWLAAGFAGLVSPFNFLLQGP